MPIVYVHGVAVRDRASYPGIEAFLRTYVAPKLAPDPQNVPFIPAFWGPSAAMFEWNHASLPDVAAKQGVEAITLAERGTALVEARVTPPPAAAVTKTDGSVARMGPETAPAAAPPPPPPTLSVDETVDLFCAALAVQVGGDPDVPTTEHAAASIDYARAAVAIDAAVRAVASGKDTLTLDTPTLDAIRREAQRRDAALPADAFIAQGGIGDWVAGAISTARNKVGEAVQGAQDAWGDAMAQALFGIRKPLTKFVTMFIGDVIAYINGRDAKTGTGSKIVGIVLDALREALAAQQRRNGERIVVLSHSMGGQLVYDALTYYVPRDPALQGLKVELWTAAASQVGLFEELKLLRPDHKAYSAAAGPVPALDPDRCAKWLNVWDRNDFLCFTVKNIFQGAQDEEFKSDRTPLEAHGGYLVLPRFYQRMAELL